MTINSSVHFQLAIIKKIQRLLRVLQILLNYIHDVKDGPVLQVSFQEPSMSSKYPHEGPPILDTLLIKISTQNFQGIVFGSNRVIYDIMDDPIIQVSGQEP